jgi:hypothetical protein
MRRASPNKELRWAWFSDKFSGSSPSEGNSLPYDYILPHEIMTKNWEDEDIDEHLIATGNFNKWI